MTAQITKKWIKDFWPPLLASILSPLIVGLIIYLFTDYRNSIISDVEKNHIIGEIQRQFNDHKICLDKHEARISIIEEAVDQRFNDEDVKFQVLKDYINDENVKLRREIYEGNKEIQELIIKLLSNGRETSEENWTESEGNFDYSERDRFGPTYEIQNPEGMENYWRNMYGYSGSIPCSMGSYPPWLDNLCNNRPSYFVKRPWNMGWISNR